VRQQVWLRNTGAVKVPLEAQEEGRRRVAYFFDCIFIGLIFYWFAYLFVCLIIAIIATNWFA
jgi:hypothetical protein